MFQLLASIVNPEALKVGLCIEQPPYPRCLLTSFHGRRVVCDLSLDQTPAKGPSTNITRTLGFYLGNYRYGLG